MASLSTSHCSWWLLYITLQFVPHIPQCTVQIPNSKFQFVLHIPPSKLQIAQCKLKIAQCTILSLQVCPLQIPIGTLHIYIYAMHCTDPAASSTLHISGNHTFCISYCVYKSRNTVPRAEYTPREQGVYWIIWSLHILSFDIIPVACEYQEIHPNSAMNIVVLKSILFWYWLWDISVSGTFDFGCDAHFGRWKGQSE